MGVVCAILPATNPGHHCGGKAVGILKACAVIFKASSRAFQCTAETVRMMREGLKKVGAPEDLIQILEDPGRDGIAELMRVSDLVVATGSGAVVRRPIPAAPRLTAWARATRWPLWLRTRTLWKPPK